MGEYSVQAKRPEKRRNIQKYAFIFNPSLGPKQDCNIVSIANASVQYRATSLIVKFHEDRPPVEKSTSV